MTDPKDLTDAEVAAFKKHWQRLQAQPRDPFTTRQERESRNLKRFDTPAPAWVWWVAAVVLCFVGYVLFGLGRAYERGVLFP